MMNLLHTGRKLCFTSSVYNMNLCSETESCSCSIHCNVSAAYYNNLLACCDRGIVVITESLHQVASCKVLVSGEYAVSVLTRDTHEFRKTCTGTDKYSGEAFVIH